jgi:lysophospholipase L1-like esterase
MDHLLQQRRRLVVTALAIAAVFTVGLTSGIAAGWLRWKQPPADRQAYRWLVIKEHAAQIQPGGTLVLGDNIIERQYIKELCGAALNAGVGGAVVADLLPHASALIGTYEPGRVVVNVGINDASSGTSPVRFTENYEALLQALAGRPVLVVGIPGGGTHDDVLRDLLTARANVRYLSYPVTADGTLDGLHLNRSGAMQWQEAVKAAACT